MAKRLLLILLFTFSIGLSGQTSRQQQPATRYYKVSKVVDGDTFWVDDGSEKGIKVRLIGVDAPETRRTNKKEIGYFASESKKFLTDKLTGQEVRLASDVGKFDRYNRLLAYVYLKDGSFINAELVKWGYAMVMTVPPNVKHADLFLKLQREAREKSRGLWKQ
jgi:micrococcal nuclease